MTRLYSNTSTEGAITVVSTSNRTANATTIELRPVSKETRLVFEPTLVENTKEPINSVRGKIVYERKSKHDALFPSQRGAEFISKRSIKKDDALEITLSSSETRKLYCSLQRLYKIHEDIGGMPRGTSIYVEVDNACRTLLELLRNDASAARMISDKETFDLVKELLRLLTQGATRDSLGRVFEGLENGDLTQLSTGINLEMLERAVSEIEKNMTNGSEEFWQKNIFESNPWIISQLFSAPCVLYKSKAYVGGKSIHNTRGNVVDFIYQNKMTKNVALIEIKTPKTKLLGGRYRGRSYSVSPDLSGAINQILSYRHTLVSESMQLRLNSSAAFETFSPKCIILAGNTAEFCDSNEVTIHDAVGSFENFRNSLNGITIVTFDELLQKVKDLLSLFRQTEPSRDISVETPPGPYVDESFVDIPF